MSNINELVYEAVNKPKRFSPKVRRINIATQRKIFGGQRAAAIARKNNPVLDARKTMYRRLYLQAKAREQQMYQSRAKSEAMRR